MAVTLCPVAIVAGCDKCPIFSVCPLKSMIGDQPSTTVRNAPEGESKAQSMNKASDS